MLINKFKGCTNTIAGYYILYIVTEKILDSLSRIVSSVRFKTGSKKEIQVVALNKTGTQCICQWMDGWVRVLRPFNSISVISRRWKGEHERLCAMKRRLGSGRISPPAGFEPATPWSKLGALTARPRGRFSPEWGEVAGIPWGLESQNSHCLQEFDRRLWQRGGTLDVSARKLKKLWNYV